MSLDRSLRAANSLSRHRNVLKRDERIARMETAGKWDPSKGVLGIPKVSNRKRIGGGKPKKEAAEGDAAAAPAAAAAAPAAKGAKK